MQNVYILDVESIGKNKFGDVIIEILANMSTWLIFVREEIGGLVEVSWTLNNKFNFLFTTNIDQLSRIRIKILTCIENVLKRLIKFKFDYG